MQEHGYIHPEPKISGGMHCVNPNCALAKPRLKAMIEAGANPSG